MSKAKSYVQFRSDEKETVLESIRAEYSDESRIAFGAYVSKLAEERLSEVSKE